jgi:hypothetical protein
MRPPSRPPRLIEVYEDTEYAWVKLTDLLSRSVMRGAIGRGYPFQGMSARRLSMEIRMTLASFGGPAGAGGGVAEAAALAEACGAALDAAADGPAEAAGSTCGAEATAGGASFEQATSATGTIARAARTMQLRTRELVTSTLPDGKFFPRSVRYDSTVICSFSRSSK